MRPRALSRAAVATSAAAHLCAVLLLLPAAPAAAQTLDASSPAIYRLDVGSTYQTGCFEPCLCPILAEVPVRGTFILTPDGFDGDFARFKVEDVNWTVALADRELRATGTGLFWTGGDSGAEQRLQLELKVGEAAVERFDSGFVKGAVFPAIQVKISIHGMYCYDTVFSVAASPAPSEEIQVYRMMRDSTFQRGCVGLCDCLLEEPRATRGTFLLVPLESNWLFDEYAVASVRWRVEPLEGLSSEALPIRGFGTYRVGGEFALEQRLYLDLEVGDAPLAPYDSGRVLGGSGFPRIDVRVANGDPLCYQTVIDVQARPRAHWRLLSR
jgi:hypothetical protein